MRSNLLTIRLVILTLLFLDNRRFPAGLLVILAGLMLGLIFGKRLGWAETRIGLYLPTILPFGWPSTPDFSFALVALVLPQIPMTLGNAVMAYADLSEAYFGDQSKKITYKTTCISMALANFFSSIIGGMPLCHGAGGLAASWIIAFRRSVPRLPRVMGDSTWISHPRPWYLGIQSRTSFLIVSAADNP